MEKKTTNVRSLIDKYDVNCDKIKTMVLTLEKEERTRSDQEEKEYAELVRENQLIEMKLRASASEHLETHPNAKVDAEKMIRENLACGAKTQIEFVREIMVVSDVDKGGIIPLNIQDILRPLTEGFILDKVGLPMPTGLSGEFVWPVYEMVEATVLGEGVELADTKIPFSKMTATPGRIGIAIPVSYQTVNQTDGLLDKIVRELMPESVRQLLNNIILSRVPVNSAAKAAGLVGPFVEAVKTAVNLSHVPTFKELNVNMNAKVLESGIDGEHRCWTMTKSMEAILQGTPVNEKGIFVPMIQDGKLCGLPVYTSNKMRDVETKYKKYTSTRWEDYSFQESRDTVTFHVSGDTDEHALATIKKAGEGNIAEVKVLTENIGLGDWRYQPMGLFGSIRFVVDPYSKARQDAVDFVLNVNYATKTLRPEGFILGKVAPSV